MKDLTPLSLPEIHQYKSTIYAKKPFGQTEWNEIDRINAELKRRDEK